MLKEIIMPKLGETMEEGFLSKWFKQEGESVEKGDPLFEVMSDKTNFEVEAAGAGVLRKILVPASDQAIPVTRVLGYLADSMEEALPAGEKTAASGPAEAGEEPADASGTAKEVAVSAGEAPSAGDGGRIPASPLARRLARELKIELARVKGSGPGGRIIEKDIKSFAGQETRPAAPAPAGTGKTTLSPLRRIIAERLSRSKREIPHYYLRKTLDVSGLVVFRERMKSRLDGLTYTDVLVVALAGLLREFPGLNATFQGQELTVHSEVNLGVAVGRPEGLIVPVIKDAGQKRLAEIVAERRRLITSAREDRLSRDEVEGGTFTLSNLGVYRIDSFYPIIYQPQVAIMGVGAIRESVVASGNTIAIKPVLEVTLACDHRVVDGADSALFLQRLPEIMAEKIADVPDN